MNQVIVVGPTFIHDTIYVKKELQAVDPNDGIFNHVVGGGSYLIAYSLASLKVDVSFITRLGNDDAASSLWNRLENKNVTLFSKDIPFPTPRIISIVDPFNRYDIDNLPFEIHPDPSDNMPSFAISKADYGLMNLINSELAAILVNRFPKVKWIAYDYLPADDVLPKLEGVILPQATAMKMTFSERYELAADPLLEKGVKWVIITDSGKGAWVYTSSRQEYLHSDYVARNDYSIGCDELFTADLLCLLSRDFPLDVCLKMALKFASHKLETPDLVFKDE